MKTCRWVGRATLAEGEGPPRSTGLIVREVAHKRITTAPCLESSVLKPLANCAAAHEGETGGNSRTSQQVGTAM